MKVVVVTFILFSLVCLKERENGVENIKLRSVEGVRDNSDVKSSKRNSHRMLLQQNRIYYIYVYFIRRKYRVHHLHSGFSQSAYCHHMLVVLRTTIRCHGALKWVTLTIYFEYSPFSDVWASTTWNKLISEAYWCGSRLLFLFPYYWKYSIDGWSVYVTVFWVSFFSVPEIKSEHWLSWS